MIKFISTRSVHCVKVRAQNTLVTVHATNNTLHPVVETEMQRWINRNFRFRQNVGGDGSPTPYYVPLLTVAVPQHTE